MAGVGDQRQTVGKKTRDQLGNEIKRADRQSPLEPLCLVMPRHAINRVETNSTPGQYRSRSAQKKVLGTETIRD
jgi:hypothetical protein